MSDNLIAGGAFAVYAEDYSPGDGAPATFAGRGNSVTDIQFDDNSSAPSCQAASASTASGLPGRAWEPYQGGPTDGWHRIGNIVLETNENIDNSNPRSNGKLCG